jgi:uncharacterized protein YndB with AHSA1/START domain
MEVLPPIVLTVDLAIGPAQAFDAFTGRFADWWPVATHSLSRTTATRCSFDARAGGRVEELEPGGARHVWGEVLVVEPGRRVRFSWYPGRDPESAQWVDVDFSPGPAGSRVTLMHGGWDALGEIGPLLRQEYLPGWRHVLGERFAAYALRATRVDAPGRAP